MARYSYEAYDRDGARVQGEVPAASRDAALQAIASKRQQAIAIWESKQSGTKWWQRDIFTQRSLSLESLALLTRELAGLAKANLPIDESLRLIAVQPLLPRRVQTIVRNILARVLEGESLSEALAAQGQTFPEHYWRLIRAGEASGSLDGALNDLATFLETSAAMRGRFVSALLYPCILVIATLGVIGVITTVLLPAIEPLFEEAKITPPFLITMLTGLNAFVEQHWMMIASGIAGLGVAFATALARPSVRLILDTGLLALPVIGRVIERRDTGRLARTLATLIKNGVPVIEATRISSSVLSNRVLSRAVRRASDEIKEGSSLSAPLARSGHFSELFLRLAAIGEQTGELDTMLSRAADIYDAALSRQMQRLISLVTPVITLVIGVAVGGLILTVMNALMSINDLALR